MLIYPGGTRTSDTTASASVSPGIYRHRPLNLTVEHTLASVVLGNAVTKHYIFLATKYSV